MLKRLAGILQVEERRETQRPGAVKSIDEKRVFRGYLGYSLKGGNVEKKIEKFFRVREIVKSIDEKRVF